MQYSGVHQEARILVGCLSNISRDHQQFQFWLRIPRCVVWLRGVMQISQFFENFVYIPRSQTPRCKLHSYMHYTPESDSTMGKLVFLDLRKSTASKTHYRFSICVSGLVLILINEDLTRCMQIIFSLLWAPHQQ